ncbi:MAG TPA: ABC transporter permease [Thermomicrobiaceae bacterium]|nr:ABC transporter permease [Thermomicrobiaceae bacterium]
MVVAPGEKTLTQGVTRERAWRYQFWGRFLSNPSAVFGGLILAILVVAALGAPLLAPDSPNHTDLILRNTPPAWTKGGSTQHLLGTDPVGRDLLSRIIYGARVSLGVGLTVTVLSAVLGVFFGLLAGYYGGWIDQVVMRIVDLFLAFPFILLAITIIAVLGAGLVNLVATLVVTSWVGYARLVRGQVLTTRELQYIDAARVAGAGNGRVILHHVLPNVITPVIVVGTLQIGFVILAEAALSFLGLGLSPSIPDWGTMVSDGRLYIYTAWWVITFPGLAIMLTVLSINMLGDWLRDVLDPTLRMA